MGLSMATTVTVTEMDVLDNAVATLANSPLFNLSMKNKKVSLRVIVHNRCRCKLQHVAQCN
jgi:hypothetical protein